MAPSSTGPALSLVAAVARNRVIGTGNRLPWVLPTDLRHFRALTMNKPVLMGRRTFESIGRPLPGRHLVVLSRDAAFRPDGVAVAASIAEALHAAAALAERHGAGETMVAGGGHLYAALIGHARRMFLTEVDAVPDGDTLFPAIDAAAWRCVAREPVTRDPRDEADMHFTTWERR